MINYFEEYYPEEIKTNQKLKNMTVSEIYQEHNFLYLQACAFITQGNDKEFFNRYFDLCILRETLGYMGFKTGEPAAMDLDEYLTILEYHTDIIGLYNKLEEQNNPTDSLLVLYKENAMKYDIEKLKNSIQLLDETCKRLEAIETWVTAIIRNAVKRMKEVREKLVGGTSKV